MAKGNFTEAETVIFDRVVYIFLKGCRHEHAQKNPFNAA
jgi:hypothetical protein